MNVEVRSPDDGTIVETYAGEGDEVNVGDPLFVLALGEASADTKPAPKEQAPTKAETAPPKKEPSPVAPKNEAPAPGNKAAPSKESSPKKDSSASNYFSEDRSETRVKMSRMRQRIAQRLKESQNTAAMLTTFQVTRMKLTLGNTIQVTFFCSISGS